MKSVEVSFEKSEATDYVLEILSLGICSLFFPMSFVQERGKLTGCCETEGFRCLTSFTELGTGDILHIASAILRGAGQAEERYIFSELYQIEPCCVYVDKTFVQVKLVFQPARQQKTTAEQTAQLLRYMGKRCGVEGAVYAENAAEIVQSDGYGLRSRLHRLENLRREVDLCGIR